MRLPEEMRMQLIDKAAGDEDLRSRMLSDPRNTIERELNLENPESLKVRIHEDSEETAHLMLPPNTQLSETQLSQVLDLGMC